MQVKWLIAIIITAIITIYAGNFAYDYSKKTNRITQYIEEQKVEGVEITHGSVKIIDLTGTVFRIDDITVSYGSDFSLSAGSVVIDLETIGSGATNFSDIEFKFRDIKGNADTALLHNLNITKNDKIINFTLLNAEIIRKDIIVSKSEIALDFNQAFESMSLKASITSFDGDSLTAEITTKGDKALINNVSFEEYVMKSNIRSLHVNLKNRVIFNRLTNEYPFIKEYMNDFGIKFSQHHYPKSQRNGIKLLNFLLKKDNIKISMEAKKDINLPLENMKYLKKADVMVIFNSLGLDVK